MISCCHHFSSMHLCRSHYQLIPVSVANPFRAENINLPAALKKKTKKTTTFNQKVNWDRNYILNSNESKTKLHTFNHRRQTTLPPHHYDLFSSQWECFTPPSWPHVFNWREVRQLHWIYTYSNECWYLVTCQKVFLIRVHLVHFKSTFHPCIENCCHIWSGIAAVQLEVLDEIKRRISKWFAM